MKLVSRWLIGCCICCLLGCGTSGAKNKSVQESEIDRLHQRAAKQFSQGHYSRAISIWEQALGHAYQQDELERAARFHYHLAQAEWQKNEGEYVGGKVGNHLQTARVLQDDLGDVKPWLLIALAEEAVAREQLSVAESYCKQVIGEKAAASDYRAQAHLILAEISLLDIKGARGKSYLAESMDEVSALLPKLSSHEVKRRYYYLNALRSLLYPNVSDAVPLLQKAVEEAELGGDADKTAQHLYELSRLQIVGGEPRAGVMSAYRAAQIWESIGKTSTACWAMLQSRVQVDALEDEAWRKTLREYEAHLVQTAGTSLLTVNSWVLLLMDQGMSGE